MHSNYKEMVSLKPCIARVTTASATALRAIPLRAPCVRAAAVRPTPTHRG